MLFQHRFAPGIADGSITMTFRRWKRRQVVAGNRYRTPGGIVEVDAVDIVEPDAITEDEAIAAGHTDAEALVADLPGTAGLPVYRIGFHLVDEPDPRELLANDDDLDADSVAEITRRLERLDRASKIGPWTERTLRLIAAEPEVRAGDLAASVGRERNDFKKDVRKLKNLGLTLSFNPGYRLSPRGVAYVNALGLDGLGTGPEA